MKIIKEMEFHKFENSGIELKNTEMLKSSTISIYNSQTFIEGIWQLSQRLNKHDFSSGFHPTAACPECEGKNKTKTQHS